VEPGVDTAIDEVAFVAFVDAALPEVYHYVLRRVGDTTLAEDLTSETVLGALAVWRRHGRSEEWSTAWLVGIARHKLIDHWRHRARAERNLAAVAGQWSEATWDAPFEPGRAAQVMRTLNAMQRAALTFRYRDGLAVADVAALLGRSVTATENLLARARRVFRDRYVGEGGDDGD
jgi:RNA polymerase sigma-70 factor (ECF subfamily)